MRGEQLLGEQRVAAAALVQLGGQRGIGRAAEDPLELGGHALAAERRQLRQHHAVVVLQLGEHLADRVGAAQLAGAEADRHGQPLPAQAAHEEAHELARGAVDPVDVLEDHEHRRAAPERAQQRHDRLEHARLREAVRLRTSADGQPGAQVREGALELGADLGAQPGQGLLEPVGIGVAQQRRERRERQVPAVQAQALAAQHRHAAVAGEPLALTEEAALADARLTDDQRHRRIALPRALERVLERLELRASLHEAAAGDTRGHGAIILRRWRASSARPTPTSAVAARRSATA